MRADNFTKVVLEYENPYLLYFTTLEDGELMKTEWKYFAKLVRYVRGAIDLGVYRVKPEELAAVKKDHRLKDLKAGRPLLRYYPNRMKGDVKNAASFSIKFDLDEKDLQPIYEEIHTSFEHEVNAINP